MAHDNVFRAFTGPVSSFVFENLNMLKTKFGFRCPKRTKENIIIISDHPFLIQVLYDMYCSYIGCYENVSHIEKSQTYKHMQFVRFITTLVITHSLFKYFMICIVKHINICNLYVFLPYRWSSSQVYTPYFIMSIVTT